MGLLGILCFLICLEKILGQEQTYVISAPKAFHVGAAENIVIQVYGYTEAFDATISIKSYPDKKISYSSGYVNLSPENKFQNAAILTIQPKQLSGGQNSVSFVYLEVVSKHFSKSKKMPITYDNGFLFLHTDKPVYTPQESVKVRVYSLNDDLKPAKRKTVLTFIDPEGSEVDIVEENDYTGIISFPDFKIPSNPEYGEWKIQAKYKEDFSTTGTAYFEIKEYGGFSEEVEVTLVKHVLSPYKLDLVATPLFLKPGIPYPIKVQVKGYSNQVVGRVPVTLNAQAIHANQKTTDLESKKSVTHLRDGVASFVVNVPSGVTTLKFKVKTDAPGLPEEKQASKEYRAIAYSSPSQSYLYIGQTGNYRPLLVGEQLNITVTSQSPYIDKITHYNYLISSRGKIVHFGTTEKVLDSSFQSINIPVTQNMVPSARLLVYYIITGEQTVELVSDSVCLNIKEKCDNQLQVLLSSDTEANSPIHTVCLNMTTESDSLVALTAMNNAVSRVQGRVQNPVERVFQVPKKSDLGCGAAGGRDNADVFHLAGLTFLTNANADDSPESADDHGKAIRIPVMNLQDKRKKQAAKNRQRALKKCCQDGARYADESCAQRVALLTESLECITAFNACCVTADKIRNKNNQGSKMIIGAPASM